MVILEFRFLLILACVIEAYGAGNLPINRVDIRDALKEACKAGINF
jgi:hypothetical protein